MSCKHCHEGIVDFDDSKIISLCDCKNYLHRDCADSWLKTNNKTKCEICEVDYNIDIKRRFNFKKCGTDFGRWVYLFSGYISFLIAIPFLALGFTVLDLVGDIAFVWAAPIVGGIGIHIICFVCTWDKHKKGKKLLFPWFNNDMYMYSATWGFVEIIIVAVIQCLGVVVVNPILGRPIEFTPKIETFGIMVGLLCGLGLVILIGAIIYRFCSNYITDNWITEEKEVMDQV